MFVTKRKLKSKDSIPLKLDAVKNKSVHWLKPALLIRELLLSYWVIWALQSMIRWWSIRYRAYSRCGYADYRWCKCGPALFRMWVDNDCILHGSVRSRWWAYRNRVIKQVAAVANRRTGHPVMMIINTAMGISAAVVILNIPFIATLIPLVPSA